MPYKVPVRVSFDMYPARFVAARVIVNVLVAVRPCRALVRRVGYTTMRVTYRARGASW